MRKLEEWRKTREKQQVTSDKWRVTSNEWRVTSIEWRMISDELRSRLGYLYLAGLKQSELSKKSSQYCRRIISFSIVKNSRIRDCKTGQWHNIKYRIGERGSKEIYQTCYLLSGLTFTNALRQFHARKWNHPAALVLKAIFRCWTGSKIDRIP